MPATSACLPVPLGICVDAAFKSKIWSNQFVDLSILLSSQTSQSFQIQLEEKRIKRGKPGLSSLYAAIFWLYKYIQEISQMLGEYAATRYDQQMFRKWRQSTRLPWNVIN